MEKLIELQEARLAALNQAVATAERIGDLERLAELATEVAEAEDILARLRNA
jgi:hypothetical protein